jgi:hypothetical protein
MVISCNRFTNLLFFFLSKWNVKKEEKAWLGWGSRQLKTIEIKIS